jgi:acetyl-CoA C-acetyltransferase
VGAGPGHEHGHRLRAAGHRRRPHRHARRLRREDVDAYAVESQRRAARAREAGWFAGSIVPVQDMLGQTILGHDEFIKPQTTLEGLAKLKPSFEQLGALGFDATAIRRYPQVERIRHVHHAGNSSGIVDGAAAVLVGSEAKGKALGLAPRARVVATALSGADPTIMLTGPMPATRKALAKAASPSGRSTSSR